jgi:hypothetical protein
VLVKWGIGQIQPKFPQMSFAQYSGQSPPKKTVAHHKPYESRAGLVNASQPPGNFLRRGILEKELNVAMGSQRIPRKIIPLLKKLMEMTA